jgi:hypothetical protein
MNARWIQSRRSMLVGLLGATVLFVSPISAQADQGKWWNPEKGARRSAQRNEGNRPQRNEAYRQQRNDTYQPQRNEAYRPQRNEAYRPPASRDQGSYRQGPRYSRSWQGRRMYRDRVWVRSDWGNRGRPVYGWRYYSRPSYYYPRHIVYVHPVRFFISLGGVIGGAHVHGSYSNQGDIYGCNFCDEEFSSYDAWEAHVANCPYAPRGYRVCPSDWDQGQWNDQGYQDDHAWQQDQYQNQDQYDGE